MRVLITWGSKRGGTAGIGEVIARELEQRGNDVVAEPVERVRTLEGFDAVILGGALYMNRWPSNARRFVRHHVRALRKVPVWFFSSGPLDDSADQKNLPPPEEVASLVDWVGAQGHVTFGGRLLPDAKGFPASQMAKTKSGDWRNERRIRAFAEDVAAALPSARPRPAVDYPAGSPLRVLGYGFFAAALCALFYFPLYRWSTHALAAAVHVAAAALFYAAVGSRYFQSRGSRQPLSVAGIWFAELFALYSFIGAVFFAPRIEPWRLVGFWLAAVIAVLTTWATGMIRKIGPMPKPAPQH